MPSRKVKHCKHSLLKTHLTQPKHTTPVKTWLRNLQVTFPGCTIPSPSLAQSTFNDIKHFASAHRVDFVSAAYIQTAEDAQYLRRFMVECDHGESIRLIARIENEAGLRNVDDILGEADGIMLCRGSLSCELGPEKLALMQKLLAAKAQAAGKLQTSSTVTHLLTVALLQTLLQLDHVHTGVPNPVWDAATHNVVLWPQPASDWQAAS